jgi:hypothetical protein
MKISMVFLVCMLFAGFSAGAKTLGPQYDLNFVVAGETYPTVGTEAGFSFPVESSEVEIASEVVFVNLDTLSATDVRGKFALVYRDLNSSYLQKFRALEAAGASGVLMVNRAESTSEMSAPAGETSPLTGLMLPSSVGEKLRTALQAGQKVIVKIPAVLDKTL